MSATFDNTEINSLLLYRSTTIGGAIHFNIIVNIFSNKQVLFFFLLSMQRFGVVYSFLMAPIIVFSSTLLAQWL